MAASSGGWGDPGGGGWRDTGSHLPTPGNPAAMNLFKEDTCMLLIKGDDKLHYTRPRDIYTNITKLIPNIQHCKRLNSGDYLIKIKLNQKQDILKIQQINNIPIKIEEAWSMNQTKVTIKHATIETYTNDELLNDLKDKNEEVVAVEIQTRWVNNVQRNSEYAIVTLDKVFSELQLKTMRLNLFWEPLKVQLYLPPPRRCKICWSFDHFSSKSKPCNSPRICGNCTMDYHLPEKTNETCQNQRKCLNCGSKDHPAWSRDCETYRKEQTYWDKATRERISYKLAKILICNETKKKSDTLAQRLNQPDHQHNHQPQVRQDNQMDKISRRMEDLTITIQQLCKLIAPQLLKRLNYTNDDSTHDQHNDTDEDYDQVRSRDKNDTDSLHLLHREAIKTVQRSSVAYGYPHSSILTNYHQALVRNGGSQSASEEEDMDDSERRSSKRRGERSNSGGEPAPKKPGVPPPRGNNNPPPQYARAQARHKPT